jgi:hypothetical protein
MYIERIILAQLLETKPSNIRKTHQVEEKINVQLWSSKEPIIVDAQQYEMYVKALRSKDATSSELLKNQNKIQSKGNSGGTKKGIGLLLMIAGAIIGLNGYMMNTTVSTDYGSVNNIGLMNEQQKHLLVGGIAFIAGVILYSSDRKEHD